MFIIFVVSFVSPTPFKLQFNLEFHFCHYALYVYGPELLNVSIRRIRLNNHILLNEKIGVNSIYKVIDVYVYLDVM